MRQIVVAIIDIDTTSDVVQPEVYQAIDDALAPFREDGVDWTYKQFRRPPEDRRVTGVTLAWSLPEGR